MTPFKNIVAIERDKVNHGVFELVGTGAPTDGTTGTGFGLAGPGSTYTRTSNGTKFINTGTKASPVWKLMTVAA